MFISIYIYIYIYTRIVLYMYVNTEFIFGKFMINPALRLDYFDFKYQDLLTETYSNQSENKAILSPKLNFLYNTSNDFQLYLKLGKSFHSNDTRVVVAQEGEEILPAAYGSDIGMIWKLNPKIILNSAFWYLYLEQEFVYVGDAGIVEPSGKTRRQGVDVSYRYQPLSWLYWNLDANYTYARSIEENEGQDYIPLAPDFTLVSGINATHKSGLHGSFNVRYLDNRPANEGNSDEANPY